MLLLILPLPHIPKVWFKSYLCHALTCSPRVDAPPVPGITAPSPSIRAPAAGMALLPVCPALLPVCLPSSAQHRLHQPLPPSCTGTGKCPTPACQTKAFCSVRGKPAPEGVPGCCGTAGGEMCARPLHAAAGPHPAQFPKDHCPGHLQITRFTSSHLGLQGLS